MTPATYRGLAPGLLLLIAVAVPVRALDEPRNVGVPLDRVHVMLGAAGEVAAGWASRAVVGDAAAGIPLQLVDLAAEERTTLTAEASWRPWWAAPIAAGWLQLDIQPEAWAAGALPAWSGALHWRLVQHRASGQQPVAEGVIQAPDVGAASGASAAPLAATDGQRVATWEQTVNGGATTWHIVIRSLDDAAVLSDRIVGPVSALAVDDGGVAWTDMTVIDGVAQTRLLWAPTDGDPFLIDTTADGAAPDAAISDISLAEGQLVWQSADSSWTASMPPVGVPGAAVQLSSDGMASRGVAADGGAVAWIESANGASAINVPDRVLVMVAGGGRVALRLPPQVIDSPARGGGARLDSMAAGDGWLTIALRPAAGQPQRLLAFPWGLARR